MCLDNSHDHTACFHPKTIPIETNTACQKTDFPHLEKFVYEELNSAAMLAQAKQEKRKKRKHTQKKYYINVVQFHVVWKILEQKLKVSLLRSP